MSFLPAAAQAGDGTFPDSLGTTVPSGTNPSSLATGDFNSDGNADLVIANGLNDNNVAVRLGNGGGGFSTTFPSATWSAEPYPTAACSPEIWNRGRQRGPGGRRTTTSTASR